MVVLITNLHTADSDYRLDNVNYWLPDITARAQGIMGYSYTNG